MHVASGGPSGSSTAPTSPPYPRAYNLLRPPQRSQPRSVARERSRRRSLRDAAGHCHHPSAWRRVVGLCCQAFETFEAAQAAAGRRQGAYQAYRSLLQHGRKGVCACQHEPYGEGGSCEAGSVSGKSKRHPPDSCPHRAALTRLIHVQLCLSEAVTLTLTLTPTPTLTLTLTLTSCWRTGRRWR